MGYRRRERERGGGGRRYIASQTWQKAGLDWNVATKERDPERWLECRGVRDAGLSRNP